MLNKKEYVLNEVYFDGDPEAVITIQSSQRTYGHITVGKVWKDSIGSYHEINISAEYLTHLIEDVISTLMHECCHLYAMEKGYSYEQTLYLAECAEGYAYDLSNEGRMGYSDALRRVRQFSEMHPKKFFYFPLDSLVVLLYYSINTVIQFACNNCNYK